MDALHTAGHVQTNLGSIYAADVCFISQITMGMVLMERNSAHPEELEANFPSYNYYFLQILLDKFISWQHYGSKTTHGFIKHGKMSHIYILV